jgi:nucleoside phosphorylase
LHMGDVVVVDKALNFDLGDQQARRNTGPMKWLNPILKQPEPIVFYSEPAVVRTALGLSVILRAHDARGKLYRAKVLAGGEATTNHFPNSLNDYQRMQKQGYTLAAMETASVLNVCWLYRQSCVAIRGVSNLIKPNPQTPYSTWNARNEKQAVDNAAKTVIMLLSKLSFVKKESFNEKK